MNIAVLVSGSGTNLAALLERARHPEFGGEIVVVISDRPDCQALERAEAAGIGTATVGWGEDRTAFTKGVCDAAQDAGAEAMILAGFMRILGPEAVVRFPNRILNVHPSLLPAFPGTDAVEQALAYGVTITGLTVHLVDEFVDHGPIVAQRSVPVLQDDDATTLHARIQREEHSVYPMAVEALVQGRLIIDGRRVIWR